MTKRIATKSMGSVSLGTKPTILKEQFTSLVRQRAYEIYKKRGGSPGSDISDWVQAEKELKSQYNVVEKRG